VAVAASRRLQEELGIACPLLPLGRIRYRARVPANPVDRYSELIEYEHVALFGGIHGGPMHPDPSEVEQVQAIAIDGESGILLPNQTPWFALYLRIFGAELADRVRAGAATPEVDYGFLDCDAVQPD
jgi:isopentenyldiphosphate isomerase